MNDILLQAIITIAVMMGVLQGLCAYLIYVERKIAAYMQDRIGPNRVGPFGLLQPIADGLKFLFKEEVIPSHVDKLLFLLAPAIAVGTATLAFAVVPFGPTSLPSPLGGRGVGGEGVHEYQFVIAPHVDIGILFTFAVSSLTVYGVILGGWSSNSKYSFLGCLRSSAQIISYEIPMGLSIVGILLFARSLNLERVIDDQVQHGWNILYQPLAFVLFLTSVLAECNRLPFDLPEAEQELVGGYHTEYSALKFGLFFLGEYTHVITTSLLLSVLFLGGWHFPWLAEADSGIAPKLIVIWIKAIAFILFYMLIRWTIPRFRFDQLMSLAWKVFIPLALINLVCVMTVLEMQTVLGVQWSKWVLLPVSLVLLIGAALLSARQPPQTRRPIDVFTQRPMETAATTR
jgi:NADH-quinone oxidoreductase subunit H